MAGPWIVGFLLPVATAATFGYVGAVVLKRRAGGHPRTVAWGFALGWFCLASFVLLGSAPTVLHLLDVHDPGWLAATNSARAIPTAVGLVGLMQYLVYIYTGNTRLLLPITIGYAVFLAFELWATAQMAQWAFVWTGWSVAGVAGTQAPLWVRVLRGVLVAGPILAALLFYSLLHRRTMEPRVRRRIRRVSVAMAAWFSLLGLDRIVAWNHAVWWEALLDGVGLAAALGVASAYRPEDAPAEADPTRTEA